MGQREGGEHEASRRMKTELLIQMDGLAKRSCSVFVLAASNLPWELDLAMLRRLEKRILVPLPSADAREAMFEAHLRERAAPTLDLKPFAAQSEGYSGSDLVLTCKEAAMRPLRRLMARMEDADFEGQNQNLAQQLEPVSAADVEGALQKTRPSQTDKWNQQYDRFTLDYASM